MVKHAHVSFKRREILQDDLQRLTFKLRCALLGSGFPVDGNLEQAVLKARQYVRSTPAQSTVYIGENLGIYINSEDFGRGSKRYIVVL